MSRLAATLDPAGPDIRGWLRIGDDVQRLENAKERHRWREYVPLVRDIVPKLTKIAEVVETCWYDLNDEQQREVLQLRRVFDEALVHARAEYSPGEFFWNLFRGMWLVSHEADLRAYIYAEVRFKVAVDRAIASENRRIREMEVAAGSDPDLIAALNRGEQERKAGKMTRYTPEEFRQRFRLA